MDSLAALPDADQFEALLTREELRRARTDETLVVAVLDLDMLRDANSWHGAAAETEAAAVRRRTGPNRPRSRREPRPR